MSVLKTLTFAAIGGKTALRPEEQRRQELIKHLIEQTDIAKAANVQSDETSQEAH